MARGSSSRLRFLPLLLTAVVAAEAAGATDLRPGGTERVTAVEDGDTLVTQSGGQVRLVGIQAPKPRRGGREPWPLAGQAKAALESLVLEREVRLSFGGLEKDRHGRVLAHVYTADGTWVQGEMVRRGLARVYSFADNRAAVKELLEIEEEARRSRRGMWALEAYAVRSPETAAAHLDGYEIVEGQVIAADEVNGRVYLNFGPDWRTDFTASLSRRDARRFCDEGIEPLAYEGQRVRVRGWLRGFNGPMIDITHPEQLELLLP